MPEKLPHTSIGDFVSRQAAINPDDDYLFHNEEVVTWGQLDLGMASVARGLWDLGVRGGDRVAVLMRNRPEYLYAWLGTVRIGAIYVPVIADNQPGEVDHVLDDSQTSVLITTPDLLEPLGDVRARCNSLRQIITVGESPDPSTIELGDLMAAPDIDLPGPAPGLTDIAQISYTSGTTSKPKGVVHTHYPYVRLGLEIARVLEYDSSDRLMVVLPLFHGGAQITSILPSIAARSTVALMPGFSVSEFWPQVARYDPTQVGLMHGMQSMLLAQPVRPEEKQHRIRFTWGTTTEPIEHDFRLQFGIPSLTTYSLSECTFITSSRPGQPYRPDWAGTATMSDMEVRIADQVTGEELPRGELGIIAVRSPCVMVGYHNHPAETARALREGWLHTGDLGVMDSEGNLYFKGRQKHVIRRSGENIAGEEVEAAVSKHPAVDACAVVAVPDDVREEEVKVVIVRVSGGKVTEEDVIDWCIDRLAGFKVPRYVEFRGSLPENDGSIAGKAKANEILRSADCWDRMETRYRLDWKPHWKAGRALDDD